MAIEDILNTGRDGESGNLAQTMLPPEPRTRWQVKELIRADKHVSKFRDNAMRCYRFRDGHQLTDEDLSVLRSQKRPDNIFNIAQKFLRHWSGIERSSPEALIANPIDLSDAKRATLGELLTKYYNWAMEHSSGDYFRSEAFAQFLTTGMGWGSIFLSRVNNPAGMIGYDAPSPLRMLWPETSKRNLGQGSENPVRWIAREEWMDKDEVKSRFTSPVAKVLLDTASQPSNNLFLNWPQQDSIKFIVPNVTTVPIDKSGGVRENKENKLLITEFQWWTDEPGYYFVNPASKQDEWMIQNEFGEYKRQLSESLGLEIKDYERVSKRVYRKEFLLSRRFSLDEPKKLPGQRFTYPCMTCHFDEIDRIPYGFFSVLIDPQRYLNVYSRQILETNAASSKGGLDIDQDALPDPKTSVQKLIQERAIPGSISIWAPGSVSGNKVREKQLPQAPPAGMTLFELALKMSEVVTGTTMESMGGGTNKMAGTTRSQRQRSGLVLLSAEFDALAEYRTEEGRLVFDHMQYIADGRLIRLSNPMSPEDAQIVPLMRDPMLLDYDLTLDETDKSPDRKQHYLENLILIMPILAKQNLLVPEMLNFVDLPQWFIKLLKNAFQQKAEMAQKMMMMGMPQPGGRGARTFPEQQAKVRDLEGSALLKQAKAAALAKKSGNDMLKTVFDAVIKDEQQRQARMESQMGIATDAMQAMGIHGDQVLQQRLAQQQGGGENG